MKASVFVLILILLACDVCASMVVGTVITPPIKTNITLAVHPVIMPVTTTQTNTSAQGDASRPTAPAGSPTANTSSTGTQPIAPIGVHPAVSQDQNNNVTHLSAGNVTPGSAGQTGGIYDAMTALERQQQQEREQQRQQAQADKEHKMQAAVAVVEQKQDEISKEQKDAQDAMQGNVIQQAFHGIAGFFSSIFTGIAQIFTGRPVLPVALPGARNDGMRVDLALWWKEVPQDTTIDFDPIGGILYVYWLDGQGTICHGTPGIDGAIGPQVLDPEGWSNLFVLRDQGKVVPQEMVTQFQQQTYMLSGGSYASNNYGANGPHIVNYANLWYRIREDGTIFKNDLWRIALPVDVDLEPDQITPGMTYPVATAGAYDPCYASDENDVPLPTTSQNSDPSKCQSRASITSADLIVACKEGRLQGGFAQGWFRIV